MYHHALPCWICHFGVLLSSCHSKWAAGGHYLNLVFLWCLFLFSVHGSLWFPVLFTFPFSVLYLDNKCISVGGFLVSQMFMGVEFPPAHQGAWVAASVWLCVSPRLEIRWSWMWSGQQLPLFFFALPSVFALVLVAGDTSFRDVSFVIDLIFIYFSFAALEMEARALCMLSLTEWYSPIPSILDIEF